MTCTYNYNGETIKADIELTVKALPKTYVLMVNEIKTLTVGDKVDLVVSVEDQNISDFKVELSNNELVSYNSNQLEALKPGKVTIKVSCTFDNVELFNEQVFEVIEKPKDYKLTCDQIEELSVGDEVNNTDLTVKVDEQVVTEFTLESSDSDVVQITSNGFKALKEGKAILKIKCVFDGTELFTEIEVTVNAVSLIKTNIPETLYVNQNIDVLVYVNNEVYNDYTLVVGNEDCLYFDDSTFILEPFDVGKSEITIYYTIDGQEEQYVFNIEIIPGFELSFDGDFTLIEGESTTFKVFVEPIHLELTEYEVKSSKKEICDYIDGKLVAISFGSTKVTVYALYEGVSVIKSIDVNVNRYINHTINSNISDYLFINKPVDLKLSVYPYNDELKDVVVKISDETIIKYENNQLVALKEGTTKVLLEGLFNGKTLNKELTITVYQINDIKVEITNDLFVNETANYSVIALPSGKQINDFNFDSDNSNILLNDHVIFGNLQGNSKLTFKYSFDGKEVIKEVDIEVKELTHNIERLYIECPQAVLEGKEVSVNVSSYPEMKSFEIIYSSSDENIAKVSSEGVITGVSTGKCYIIATLKSNDQIKTIHNITVIKKNSESVVEGMVGETAYCGKYYEESVKYYYELMNGITETTYYAYTSTMTSGIDVDGYTGISGQIEPGKYYPQMVHVMQVPSNANTKVIPWANLSNDIWTLTSVKGLIQNYEENHPGEKVICAINGDFFDINANGNLPYQTTGENISDGQFYKTTNSFGGNGGTLGFTNNGTTDTLIAKHGAQRTTNMILAVYDENDNIVSQFEVENLNQEPSAGQSSVYFGTYNSEKVYQPVTFNTTYSCYYVENALRALPNNPTDFYGLGVISSTDNKELTINKGSFAIVSDNVEINKALQLGMKIRIQYEYTGEFKDVMSATGYNNVIYTDVNQLPDGYIGDRAPRTVIGKKADGTLVMMVVDGRQGMDDMYGADGTELAAIMKAYGCVCAYNLDGGGSSTIVVRDSSGFKVLNSPSDGRERSDGNCILMVMEDPNYKVDVTSTSTSVEFNVSTEKEAFSKYQPCILFDNIIYETTNGYVKIDGLVHNTIYNYQVLYKDGDNYYNTLSIGSVLTQKSGFKFLGILLRETSDSYIFSVNYDDIDNSSNIANAEICFNSISTYLTNGTVTLSKKTFGDYIDSVSFNYWYLNEGEKVNVVLNDYQDYFTK